MNEKRIGIFKNIIAINDVYNLIGNDNLTVRYECEYIPNSEEVEHKVRIGCICCDHPITEGI